MIKNLTQEEVKKLRIAVIDRFLNSPFSAAGIRITQYKKSYQPLADDIARIVEGAEVSVSTNRLRKFFYYTNPDVCEISRLENPSFGNDFIQALVKYTEAETKSNSPQPVLSQRKTPGYSITLLLLFMLMVGVGAWMWMEHDKPQKWEEDFSDVTADGLKARGWEILDYDSASFDQQTKSGYLTVYTHRGDYWWAPPDTPVITNLLIKKIENKSFRITIKIDDFNPCHDYQQAGIILLDKTRNRSHNIRFTFAADNTHQLLQMVKREHGITYEKKDILRSWELNHPPTSPVTPMWLQIQVDGNRFRFFGHKGAEFDSFWESGDFYFDFTPVYVGIGAFRGIRNRERQWNNAEAIPAFFDYLKVDPF
jgi:hypothetical protein